jgi:hypothetical protein
MLSGTLGRPLCKCAGDNRGGEQDLYNDLSHIDKSILLLCTLTP